MRRTKYIKTKDNQIVVFGEGFNHSDFNHLNPISAGFISIGIGKDGNPDLSCYGESISLGMKSDEVNDTIIAKMQILGWDPWMG